MRIIVSSNCQTGGLTAGLRLLLPDHQVDPCPDPDLTAEDRSHLIAKLQSSDKWLVTAPADWVGGVVAEGQLDALQVLVAPELYFDAFHPDLVYAWLPENRTLDSVAGPYNSAIGLWAWRRGLNASQAAELFTPAVFGNLGYTDRWRYSVERLDNDFAKHGDLDYRDFLLPLQRHGVFMHTVNHPTVTALAQLSRQVAGKLGTHPDLLSEPIENFMIDGLMVASVVWPVYPGISDSLGMKGSFTWKLADHSVVRLGAFLHGSFERYGSTDPSSLSCHQLDWPIYDLVLEPALAGALR